MSQELIAALVTVAAGVILSFWGWLAVKVNDQGKKLVELESKQGAKLLELEKMIQSRDAYCAERLDWIRKMEGALDQIKEDTLTIRTKLGEPPHAS